MTNAQKRAILKADQARRDARDIEEYLELHALKGAPKGVDPYHYSRSITGVPSNNNRVTRNHDTSKYPRDRAVGTATDDNGAIFTPDGQPTVRVIRQDGASEIVPASTFRAKHVSRRVRATTSRATTNAASRYESMLAQVGAIGNVE